MEPSELRPPTAWALWPRWRRIAETIGWPRNVFSRCLKGSQPRRSIIACSLVFAAGLATIWLRSEMVVAKPIPEIVPRAEPLTDSDDARVAAAAITSLYGLDLAHSAALIERGLRDRRDAVRHAAVKVLAVQDGAWGEELRRAVEAISRDPDGGLSARLAGRVLRQRGQQKP